MSGELTKIATVADVPEGEARRFEVGSTTVCLANLGETGFRAVDDVCSHAEAFLHEGDVDVDDATIECPRHGSTFSLESGRPTTLPATSPVATFPVKVEGDDIWIEVETPGDE